MLPFSSTISSTSFSTVSGIFSKSVSDEYSLAHFDHFFLSFLGKDLSEALA
jgi:hypothetical protein